MTGLFEIRPRAAGTSAEDRTADVLIYGDIGEGWDGETVAARTFVSDLAKVDADYLTVRINSYGGSVSDGIAIYNALKRHPAAVTVAIDGVAVSIASLIAMAGDTIQMADNALMMIHAPWAVSVGNARALRDMADTLDRYASAMTGAYRRGGAIDDDTIAGWLTDGEDHWMTAAEARAAGLIDEITGSLAIAASLPPRFRGIARKQEGRMAESKHEPAADPKPDTNVNVTEITAKAKAEARAALKQRNETIKARFDAFQAANPGRGDDIRACFDAAMADMDQTPEAFTDAVLARLAEQQSEPVAGAHSIRVESGADERDKRILAVSEAQMARAALPTADKSRRDVGGNPYRGMSFASLARDALIRAGMPTEKVMRMADMDMVAAAFTQTGSDFPVLLENTMHKSLEAGYAIAADSWRRWCAVGSVSDFRAHNRYMVGSLANLDALTEAAEFTNKAMPDGRKQSVSIGTKGNILNLTRQAVINDDMGALTGLSFAMGRAAARTIETDVYAALSLNSGLGPTLSDGKTIIHADHGNIAGTAGAPSVSTVEAGILKMAAQKDISGNDYLDLSPTIWLGPKSLETTVRVLNANTYDPAATGSSKNFMTSNPYNGQFSDIVASQRLAATKWYMLADPNIAPVIEVDFLNGVQEPFLDMEDGFTVDGARYKVRLDFGVSGVGYEGIVYNAGA